MAWDGNRRDDGWRVFEREPGRWACVSVTDRLSIDPLRPAVFDRCPCCGADIPSDHHARMIVDRLWPEQENA